MTTWQKALHDMVERWDTLITLWDLPNKAPMLVDKHHQRSYRGCALDMWDTYHAATWTEPQRKLHTEAYDAMQDVQTAGTLSAMICSEDDTGPVPLCIEELNALINDDSTPFAAVVRAYHDLQAAGCTALTYARVNGLTYIVAGFDDKNNQCVTKDLFANLAAAIRTAGEGVRGDSHGERTVLPSLLLSALTNRTLDLRLNATFVACALETAPLADIELNIDIGVNGSHTKVMYSGNQGQHHVLRKALEAGTIKVFDARSDYRVVPTIALLQLCSEMRKPAVQLSHTVEFETSF
jgi:hypothetical protein